MVPGAPAPVAPFSHATAADGWLFVTGQMPTDPDDDSAPLPEGNVWIPVPDETVAITRLLSAGWAAAPGTRFRIATPPGIRITVSSIDIDDISPLADALAEAVHAIGRASV